MMRQVQAAIGGLRRLRAWAAHTFLRPASITLVSRPADVMAARPGEQAG